MMGLSSEARLKLLGGHAWVRIWQEHPGEVSLECRCSALWRHLLLNKQYGLVLPRCPVEAEEAHPPGPGWDMKRCVGRLSGPPAGARCQRRGWTREAEYRCFQHPDRTALREGEIDDR